jgi:hypothetical protein
MFRMMILVSECLKKRVDLAVQPAQWIVEYGPKRKFEKSSPGKFFVALNIAQRP